MDLWALLSSRKEFHDNRKKGSCQMAHQTRRCLQSVALSITVMTVTKDPLFDPWVRDQNLSEVHVERAFGQVRSMSQSGDLSARSYWAFSATLAHEQMMRTKRKDLRDKTPPSTPPLSGEELLAKNIKEYQRNRIVLVGHETS